MSKRGIAWVLVIAITAAAVWWAAQVENEDDKNSVSVSKSSNAVRAGRTRPSNTVRASSANRGSTRNAKMQEDTEAPVLPSRKLNTETNANILDDLSLRRLGTPAATWPAMQHNLFPAQSFMPPPPPVPSPPPPEPPHAPPLRFKYIGMLEDNGKREVFLNDQGQLLIAHEGQALGADYRVETITAGSMVLIYLPLQERQTLTFGKN